MGVQVCVCVDLSCMGMSVCVGVKLCVRIENEGAR